QALVKSLGGEYKGSKSGDPKGENDKNLGNKPKTDENTTKMLDSERELITGMLSKTAGVRLIVTGSIGAKEIERLIAKLELDKAILAEPDPTPPDQENKQVDEWEV